MSLIKKKSHPRTSLTGKTPPVEHKVKRYHPLTPWIFLIPTIILFIVVFVLPLLYTAWQSLHDMRSSTGSGFGGHQENVFVGLSQYITSLQDKTFLFSILRVMLIGIVQVPVMLFLALVLALMLDSRRCFGRSSFHLAYFLPYAVPGVVAALMWAYLVQPSLSPFTHIAADFGIPLDLTAAKIIPVTIGNMITWSFTGYNMVIMYAALKALPSDLVEAARIDGASSWQIAWKIKVPLIRPAIVMTAIFSIIGTIQLYNEPAILENITPNVGQTFSPVMAVYYLIQNNNFNSAAARSIILALIAFILSFAFLKYQQRRGGTTLS